MTYRSSQGTVKHLLKKTSSIIPGQEGSTINHHTVLSVSTFYVIAFYAFRGNRPTLTSIAQKPVVLVYSGNPLETPKPNPVRSQALGAMPRWPLTS